MWHHGAGNTARGMLRRATRTLGSTNEHQQGVWHKEENVLCSWTPMLEGSRPYAIQTRPRCAKRPPCCPCRCEPRAPSADGVLRRTVAASFTTGNEAEGQAVNCGPLRAHLKRVRAVSSLWKFLSSSRNLERYFHSEHQIRANWSTHDAEVSYLVDTDIQDYTQKKQRLQRALSLHT